MESSKYIRTLVLFLLVKSSHCTPRPQLGLFNQFVGNKENDDRQMRALQNNPLNSNRNIFQLLQNNKPNNQIDPETKEQILQQKEKLEDILEKLKELNKKKEEEKLKQQNGSTTPGTITTVTTEKSTSRPVEVTTKATTAKPVKKHRSWKKIVKNKFFYQVRPVMPENELSDDDNEIVYYLE